MKLYELECYILLVRTFYGYSRERQTKLVLYKKNRLLFIHFYFVTSRR